MYRLIATTLIITFTSLMMPARLFAQDVGHPDVLRSYVEKLPIGSLVKVKMKEGRDVRGTLMVIEPDAIVVKPKTRVNRPERRLAYTDVEFVEVQTRNGSNIAKSVAIGMATGAGAFLGLIFLTVAIIND